MIDFQPYAMMAPSGIARITAVDSTFNLHETVSQVMGAMNAVLCNIVFWAAVHGLAMALFFGLLGFILFKRKIPVGKPFMLVCRRLVIVCAVLAIPGLICLAAAHGLPSAGVADLNPAGHSVAFIVFWSLICVHLSAEEMNHRWF